MTMKSRFLSSINDITRLTSSKSLAFKRFCSRQRRCEESDFVTTGCDCLSMPTDSTVRCQQKVMLLPRFYTVGFEPTPFPSPACWLDLIKIERFALSSQGPQPRALLHKLYLKAIKVSCTLIFWVEISYSVFWIMMATTTTTTTG